MEEENKYSVKKYLYVSPTVKVTMENIMTENKILLVNRFINSYDINVFFRSELKNLQGINFLILDLASFETSKENDIITSLKLIREKYDCRIIIIAQGYKQGDIILGKIFNLGIYNIITASNDMEFTSQFNMTISTERYEF